MKTKHRLMKQLIFTVLIACMTVSCSKSEDVVVLEDDIIRSARYFDASNGNDTNDGMSPETAWKDLDTLNSLVWGPGAEILLKSGESWTAQLSLKGSGSTEKPIQFSNYGEGSMPLINGPGNNFTIKLENQEYWELSNLEITNFNASEEGMSLDAWESYNISHWAESVGLEQYELRRSGKYGILVLASDFGQVDHLHFKNLEVHGVNGDIGDKNTGGIFLEITGSLKPTWFVDLLFEECFIHDVDRTGISNTSSWSTRSYEFNTNWKPSEELVYRNNRFERTGANALIVRVAKSPLMEYNLFDHCAIKESGNASFSFNCDDALWQYNEARFTKYNIGDADAGGFDSDYRCKNTVIRYNYSHHNEYGGVLVCCQGGDTRFNVGTIVSYNLFVNNQKHVIRVSGEPENTLFHNNVIFSSGDQGDAEVIWHKSWLGYPNATSYVNNIFYSRDGVGPVDLGGSTENSFDNNIFYGNFSGDVPSNKFVFDPLFTGGTMSGDPQQTMFMLNENSPAIDAGMEILASPDKDFFGNEIIDKTSLDIGIHEKN